ncbi:MAG: hypothetical protein ACOCZX_02570 [Candidatus Bipolaricaulota bacterium]
MSLRKVSILLVLGFALFFSFAAVAQIQTEESGDIERFIQGPLNDFLTYLYTISRWAGEKIRMGANAILPEKAQLPPSLTDPLGILVLLTAFLAVAEVAKKITWFLVVVGWILILVRIGILVASSYL